MTTGDTEPGPDAPAAVGDAPPGGEAPEITQGVPPKNPAISPDYVYVDGEPGEEGGA